MSTQEREAMERLEHYGPDHRIRDGRRWPHDYCVIHADRTQSTRRDDELIVLTAALSRHARSLQPITVEGLVGMGGVKSDEYIASGFIHVVQLGVLRFEFHPQHLVVRCGTYTGTPIFPLPTNMLHVHDLIERLSR